MAENEQFTLHNELKDLRKELETKIDKKLDGVIFWTILVISAAFVGGTYIWLMSMNERISHVETKIDERTTRVETKMDTIKPSPK